jgi:hypothetical protein
MFNCFHLMHVAVFSTLGQPWLVSIQSSQRGMPEFATGRSLLSRAAPLFLPHVCRRREALATAALVLPPPLVGGFIEWLARDVGGSLHRSSSSGTPGGSSPNTRGEGFIWRFPSDSSGYNDECSHIKEVSSSIWTASRFQFFSRITKYVRIYF